MALIDCVECSKPVSTKATTCPHCGCPISASDVMENPSLLALPKSNILTIGDAVFDWKGEGSISAEVAPNDARFGKNSGGDVSLDRCTNGLRIYFRQNQELVCIDYSHIAQFGVVEAVEVERKGKSVVGRAVIGTLLLGPFGGIVGGLSGTGTNEKKKFTYELYIKYWSVESKKYEGLNLGSSHRVAKGFCNKVKGDIAKYSQLHA